ncbi:MAG: hypothetical protein ACRC3G_02460 [Bacteroidales bacterium]
MKATTRNYRQFYALLRQTKNKKESLVLDFTQGRTSSLRAMTDSEYAAMLLLLQRVVTNAQRGSLDLPRITSNSSCTCLARCYRQNGQVQY